MKRLTTILGILLLAVVAQGQTIDLTPKTLTLKVGESATVTITTTIPYTLIPETPIGVRVETLTPTTAKVTALVGGIWGVSAIGFNGVPILASPVTVTVLAPRLYMNPLGRAIAVQSPLFTAEPFPSGSRVIFFVGDVDPAILSEVKAEGTDPGGTKHNLAVEDVRKVGGFNFWQVTVKLPTLPNGDLAVSITWKGVKTNEAKIAITSTISINLPPLNDLDIDVDKIVREAFESRVAWRSVTTAMKVGIQTNYPFWQQGWSTTDYRSPTYAQDFKLLHHLGHEISVRSTLGFYFAPMWGEPERDTHEVYGAVRMVHCRNLMERSIICGELSTNKQFLVMRQQVQG